MINIKNRQSSGIRKPMDTLERRSPDRTRDHILDVAWDLFRQLGVRATVADVAKELGMSSANVYRFYPSKQALCEAVAARQLGAMTAAAREIAKGAGSAAERIKAVSLMLYTGMRDQMTHEARVHEIVAVAINERWAPIEAFERGTADLLAELIGEGQASGQFGPGDPYELAITMLSACVCIHHPTLIATQREEKLAVPPDKLVDFALRALTNRGPSPST